MILLFRQSSLLALAMIAVYLRLTFMRQFGPGLSPDSAIYFSVATNLVEGKGFMMYDGSLLTLWAPLYPFLLAATQRLFHIEPFVSVPILNSLTFGGIVYLAGILFLRHLKSPVLAFVGTVALFASLPLFEITLMAWSETLFIFLMLQFLVLFELYQDTTRWWVILLAGVSVGLASLDRYVGVVLIPLGVLLIWFLTEGTRKIRLRAILVFGSTSLLFIGAWVVRNYIVSRTLFGARGTPYVTFGESIRLIVNTILSWYVAGVDSTWTLLFFGIGVALAVTIGMVWHSDRKQILHVLERHGALLIFMIGYLAIVIYQETTSNLNPPDNRLLSPLVVPLGILLLVLIEGIVNRVVPPGYFLFASVLLAIALAWWLQFPQSSTKESADLYIQHQGRGWNNSYWRANETVEYLRREPPKCTLYSNGADVIWLQAHLSARVLLATPKNLVKNGPVCVVYFDGIQRIYITKLEALQAETNLVPIAKLKDGAVYAVSPK